MPQRKTVELVIAGLALIVGICACLGQWFGLIRLPGFTNAPAATPTSPRIEITQPPATNTSAPTDIAVSDTAPAPTETPDCNRVAPLELFLPNSLQQGLSWDFEDGSKLGFRTGSIGSWNVIPDGADNKVLQVNSPIGGGFADAHFETPFLDGCVEFQFRYTSVGFSSDQLTKAPGSGKIQSLFRVQEDDITSYMFMVIPYSQTVAFFYVDANGEEHMIPTVDTIGTLNIDADGGWNYAHIEFRGNDLKAFLNNMVITASDSVLSNNEGKLSFGAGHNTIVDFDNVYVWKKQP
jgi:hypothetical protein